MTETFLNDKVTLHPGCCLDVLARLEESSVDSCVTDPPYGLGFMGKKWDTPGSFVERKPDRSVRFDKVGGNHNPINAADAARTRRVEGEKFGGWCALWAREVFRVLKPGGHLVAFAGTRTYHRMACAIEDAGFEIRDQIGWAYGSGFPKSHDVSKGIDRAAPRVGMFGAFASHYGERRRAAGLTHNAICAAGGFYAEHNHGGASVNWEKGHNVPTREQWTILQPLLGLQDEWLPLIERVEAEREKIGERASGDPAAWYAQAERGDGIVDITLPATDAAREWQGWGTALKPAWESICLAQKPYDLSALCGILAQKLMEALCQLPSLARDAGSSSLLSQSVSAEGFGSAQWNAVAECNTLDDLFDLMATWLLKRPVPSSLSTASSWLAILAECLALANTFTTETASSLTTDLKTLNCLLSRNTPDIIAQSATLQRGTASSVSLVDRIFSAVRDRLRITHELSAADPATLTDALADLRPNWSPAVLARKPLAAGTVAENVQRFGTGALNIDGCRVGTEVETWPKSRSFQSGIGKGYTAGLDAGATQLTGAAPSGRWPANIVHDGSDEVVAAFPETAPSAASSGQPTPRKTTDYGIPITGNRSTVGHDDSGSAARFFYTCKADAHDRVGSRHPTVKPIDLMQWLVRLVTPPGGTVLDPFAGTGTTAEAAFREGMRAVLIEREEEYQADIRRRMALVLAGPDERQHASIKASGKVADAGPLFASEWDTMWKEPWVPAAE